MVHDVFALWVNVGWQLEMKINSFAGYSSEIISIPL